MTPSPRRSGPLAKPVSPRPLRRYVPGERGWVKIKDRDYWRYEIERESAINKRHERQFI
jgi:hypothetical protein